MNKKYIDEIQNKILKLLPKGRIQEKGLLLKDSCSELSRLVAYWINKDGESTSQTILKGSNICNSDRSHDILVSISDEAVYVIDPTIWQFFPDEASILVGKYCSLDEAITVVAKKYGGSWQIGEDLKVFSLDDLRNWQNIIQQNIGSDTQ